MSLHTFVRPFHRDFVLNTSFNQFLNNNFAIMIRLHWLPILFALNIMGTKFRENVSVSSYQSSYQLLYATLFIEEILVAQKLTSKFDIFVVQQCVLFVG